MYEGIFLPVKNCATSELKVLQLCSKMWYFSGLWTEKEEVQIIMCKRVSFLSKRNRKNNESNVCNILSLSITLEKYSDKKMTEF